MRAKNMKWVAGAASLAMLGGCGFSPYDLPLPGGADLGSEPYSVKIQFRDVLDLVPQSAVRVNDIAVGKVTDIELRGWTAQVTVKVNNDVKLPDNAVATIRQTSLLGEKFVSLAPPANGADGQLGNGDTIPIERAGRNPEIEEVLGAASLLFNGGGLEKTNTIVKELNNALGGNEPEVRELIQSTSTFISQLDQNKEALLTSLEKVNRLAVATNDQEDAITGALDDLPAALKVVNQQRDDLVGLLQSLDRLSDVATGVIRKSKDDTIADLKALAPTLKNLAAAGDDLATATQGLLTYPFTDGFVGGSVAAATARCQDAPEIKEGACFGDFANLSLRLDISATQLTNLLGGFDLTKGLSGDPAGTPKAPAAPAGGAGQATDPALSGGDLADLIAGLLPGGKKSSPDPAATTAPPASGGGSGATPGAATPSPKPPSGGLLCGLFGTCRTAVANSPAADAGMILLEPAVAP
ncbi:MCE family protein [Aeromicrobium sp. P5_D10]